MHVIFSQARAARQTSGKLARRARQRRAAQRRASGCAPTLRRPQQGPHATIVRLTHELRGAASAAPPHRAPSADQIARHDMSGGARTLLYHFVGGVLFFGDKTTQDGLPSSRCARRRWRSAAPPRTGAEARSPQRRPAILEVVKKSKAIGEKREGADAPADIAVDEAVRDDTLVQHVGIVPVWVA